VGELLQKYNQAAAEAFESDSLVRREERKMDLGMLNDAKKCFSTEHVQSHTLCLPSNAIFAKLHSIATP
jgi:hypothetical protein